MLDFFLFRHPLTQIDCRNLWFEGAEERCVRWKHLGFGFRRAEIFLRRLPLSLAVAVAFLLDEIASRRRRLARSLRLWFLSHELEDVESHAMREGERSE